jgi:hypothetical protein
VLEVLAAPQVQRPGGSPQNKVEAIHRFSKWLLFGGQGVLRSNDPSEYKKAVHYNELVANAVMLQTVADQTQVIRQLVEEGYPVRAEDLERLSPYATQHLSGSASTRRTSVRANLGRQRHCRSKLCTDVIEKSTNLVAIPFRSNEVVASPER